MITQFLLSLMLAMLTIYTPAPVEVEAEQSALVEVEAPKAHHVDDLAIQPEYPDELLSVGIDFQNDLSYNPLAERPRYFFDKEGNPAEEASAGGYYRDILGTTDDGKTIAQDFYQDSQTPQVAPFILRAGFEHNFDVEGNDGRVVWFTEEGKVEAIRQFVDGAEQGWGLAISELGMVRDANGSFVFINSEGQVFASLENDEFTAYYPNGQSMATMRLNSEDGEVYAWNEVGEPIPYEQVEAVFVELQEQGIGLFIDVFGRE